MNNKFLILLLIFSIFISGCTSEDSTTCLSCRSSWLSDINSSSFINSVNSTYFYVVSGKLNPIVSAWPSGGGVNKTYVDTQNSAIKSNLSNNFYTKSQYWNNLTSKLSGYLKISDWVANITLYSSTAKDYANDSATWQKRTDWTTHDNYPSSCSGLTNIVQGIGDTLTCINPNKNPVRWINYTTSAYTSTSSTVYTKMLNLYSPLEASSTYLINCNFITYGSSAANGTQLRVNTTGSPTKVTLTFRSSASATTIQSLQGVSTSSNAFASSGSAGSSIRAETTLKGIIQTSATASQIRFETKAESSSASSETYDIGSSCEYIKVS